jgi:hypothetical protein
MYVGLKMVQDRPKHVATVRYQYHILLLCSWWNKLFVLLWEITSSSVLLEVHTTSLIHRHILRKLEQFLLRKSYTNLSCKMTFECETTKSPDHPKLHTTHLQWNGEQSYFPQWREDSHLTIRKNYAYNGHRHGLTAIRRYWGCNNTTGNWQWATCKIPASEQNGQVRDVALSSPGIATKWFFSTWPTSTGPTLKWVVMIFSKSYYHCDSLSSSRHRLLNLPNTRRKIKLALR